MKRRLKPGEPAEHTRDACPVARSGQVATGRKRARPPGSLSRCPGAEAYRRETRLATAATASRARDPAPEERKPAFSHPAVFARPEQGKPGKAHSSRESSAAQPDTSALPSAAGVPGPFGQKALVSGGRPETRFPSPVRAEESQILP